MTKPSLRMSSSDAIASLRSETALVRALLDELERVAPSSAPDVRAHLVEEIARLGRRCIEVAAAMAAADRVSSAA